MLWALHGSECLLSADYVSLNSVSAISALQTYRVVLRPSSVSCCHHVAELFSPSNLEPFCLLQAAHAKQSARHSKELEELLLELSKQHAAAQAALPQQGISDEVGAKKSMRSQQQGEEEVLADSLTPQAPRLTTPISPSRRPSTHPRGIHTPPEGPPVQAPTPLGPSQPAGHVHRDDSLRAERDRSLTSSFNMSKQHLF